MGRLLVAALAGLPLRGSPALPPARMLLAAPADLAAVLRPLLDGLSAPPGVSVELAVSDLAGSLDGLGRGRLQAAMVAGALDAPPKGVSAYPMGFDGLALIANGQNPVQALSRGELKQLYLGQPPTWRGWGSGDKPVVRLIGEAGMPERRLFEQALGLPDGYARGAHVVGGGLASILFVAVDPLAIAYVSSALAGQLLAEGARIKLLALDGVRPNVASLQDGSYPMRQPITLLVAQPAAPPLRQLLALLRGSNTQAALRAAGYAVVAP